MSPCRIDMNQDGDESGANVLEGNSIMAQDREGDGSGTHMMTEENTPQLLPVADIDLSLHLSIRALPALEVAEEHNLAATEDATEHGMDAGKQLLANNMDANEHLAHVFLQLSLQSFQRRTSTLQKKIIPNSISPRKRKLAQDGNDSFFPCKRKLAQDGDSSFLQLSLPTQAATSPRKRKRARDENKGAARLIEESYMTEDGDKSGANLIEGINMAQDRCKGGEHPKEGSNMAHGQDGSGDPVLEEENIDLNLRLAINPTMPAPVADKKVSEDITHAKEKVPEDGADANEEILRDESEDSMVINTDAPEERVNPDTTSCMDSD